LFYQKNLYGYEKHYQYRKIADKNFVVEQFTNSKFLNDKILDEDAEFVIGTEGVILNLADLRKKYDAENTFKLIQKLYLLQNESFVKHLKGDFSGFIFDRKNNKWVVFTNQTGSKRMFYFENSDYFIFSSELKEISFLLSELKIEKKLDISAAYLLLTCGFMLNDVTLVNNVKRLLPGNFLTFNNHKIAVSEYFNLKNVSQTTDSKTEIIEKIDALFSEAVRLEFEKDKEYGYKHIATLSGGLDSRMTVLMAHKLGYIEQLNFTFSQSNYLDEKIAKQIAADYLHDFLFHSLNGGNFLKNIDEITYYNDGLILYSGSAHGFHPIKNINFDSYGIVHTGQIGDAVLGSFLSKPYAIPPSIEMGVHSKKLLTRIQPFFEKIAQKYPTEELYKFYNRAFMGALNGNLYYDVFSQTVSPFLDIDFLSYCYSIPEKYKFKEQIYLDWIAAKHPEFAKYVWEKTGISPLKSNSIKKYFYWRYYKRMSKRFFNKISGTIQSGMNPFDLWLKENIELKKNLDTYFTENITVLNNYNELKNDCRFSYENGNALDKFTVLTLLAAVKLHF
jgi:asparagine synthase (glutamine-hydrolysing)